MRRSRAIRLALGLSLLCAAFAVRASAPEPAPAPSPRIVLTGALDRTSAARVERSIERLVADGAKTILLDLVDASGSPTAALKLSDRIHDLTDVRTVACVTGPAVGAASIIALACDEIRMTGTGLIGSIDCERNDADGAIVVAALRKYQPRAILPALEGMVQRWLEVYRVEYGDGTVLVVERTELHFATRDADERGGIVDRKALVRLDALLTLDAALAESIGLTGPVVESADAVARKLGIAIAAPRPGSAIVESETTGDWTPAQCTKAAIIFVNGEIGPAMWARIERRVEKIEADGSFDLLVIQTDSPGGLVQHSELIGDLILETGNKMHTVAWIPRDAISGACLTSYAAKDIVVGPAGGSAIASPSS